MGFDLSKITGHEPPFLTEQERHQQELDVTYTSGYTNGHAAGYEKGIAEALKLKPIEEAPRDGTPFCCYIWHPQERMRQIGEGKFDLEKQDFVYDGDSDYLNDLCWQCIVYWQPIGTLPIQQPEN